MNRSGDERGPAFLPDHSVRPCVTIVASREGFARVGQTFLSAVFVLHKPHAEHHTAAWIFQSGTQEIRKGRGCRHCAGVLVLFAASTLCLFLLSYFPDMEIPDRMN